MNAQESDAIVFFGATGDLAYKKIFPALQAMVRRGHLDVPVIGVAKDEWTVDQLRARARDSLEKHGGVDALAFAKLSKLLRYVGGDYREMITFEHLRKELSHAKHPLYYLAIPPSMFPTVIERSAKSGCLHDARVVVEKPFGRDLASARALNKTLHAYLPEHAILRIDHYLGKEPVQNLLYFRFANPLFEATWNCRYIHQVQITMAEQFGISNRGRFYEEVGAIRDVVQNHMLMVIASLAMEQPAGSGNELIRDERAKVLQVIRPLTLSDVVRGQYVGYRREEGVASDSQVETFAAVRFYIDSDRWADVPFYVRVGKRLPVTATEVFVEFKRPCYPVLDEPEPPLPNYFRFQLSPHVLIALGTKAKVAGETMVGERIELVARDWPGEEMDPYKRLLGEALKGDATLFTREDGVESAWRVVDPILGTATALHQYEPNTWGPKEAEQLIATGAWHNPHVDP